MIYLVYELSDTHLSSLAPVLEIIYVGVVPGSHIAQFWQLLAFSRGSVKIATVDPFAKPNITCNYFSVPFDMDMQAEGARLIRRLFNTPPLSNLTTQEVLPGLASVPNPNGDGGSLQAWASWIKLVFGSTNHILGTCSMMRKELGGVVDGRLRVYGAKNLRVVDASVIPTQISSHMMYTLYGIAEKLADMIKSGL